MLITENKKPKNRHILPFATPAQNRLRNFPKTMEWAAVLYLAEANRKKGEYPRLKKTEEKLVFIAEACYPIWLIPYNRTTLIFDGFALVSHRFFYDVTPDIEGFNKDIQKNQKTTDSYVAALTRNMDYFRNFKGKEEITIEGLITKPDLKEDLRNYLPLMRKTNKPSTNIVFLKPIVTIHEIHTGIKQLSALKNKIYKEIENIDTSMKLLNTATARRVKAIKEEIKRTREKHSKQIKKTRVKSTKKLLQIQNQHNRKIARSSKKYKRKLLQLNKKQIKFKNAFKSLRKEAKRCETKIKSSKRHHSKRSEHHWNKKLERTRKKIQSLRKESKVTSKQISDVEKTQKRELAKHRIACCKRIELANKIFRDRQGFQEAKIIMIRQEIKIINETTQYITKLMQKMLKKKKLSIGEFERIAIRQGKKTSKLVYMPFYLVRYEKGDKRRYVIYPPSIVGGMGILTKMKGALGAAKVKTLIQPRSETTTTFLNQLPAFLEKRPMLEKDLTETGIQKSTLLKKNLRVAIAKGLKKLEKQKWISKRELEVFSKILYTYAPSTSRKLKTILIPESNYQKCLTA